jgi:pimeloyl-ACP methyl ester carboxylesterase
VSDLSASTATLVLLAPIGLDAGAWDGVELGGLVTLCHELPGFGSRPRAPEQPTMASLADEVAASYEGPLVLVGVSMGSMVAQNVAVRHAGRVRSLVLACTGAAVDADAMRRRADEVEAQGMEAVLGETLERWFTADALAARPQHPGVAYARRTLLALDAECFADGWRAIATHDVREHLGEIAAPATCVAGRADPVGTLERVTELAEGVRDGRLVVIDGPHMILLEEPAAFAAAVLDHLAWSRERAAA